MVSKRETLVDLDQLRKDIVAAREQGKKLISHQKKMEEYYEEWETEMARIDGLVAKAAQQHGLTTEEVVEYDALQDMFE